MTDQLAANSTDHAWELWGKKDPYFGVITNPKFRRAALSDQAKAEFFESGRLHVEYIFQMVRLYIDPAFEPKRALDFGCGVGRIAIPMAKLIPEVVGVDVSPSMLAEARQNAATMGVANVDYITSDDGLSQLNGTFDLIHSYIVFQHIPPARGRDIFAALVKSLAPGGVGAMHFVYSKAQYAETNGLPPPLPPAPLTAIPSPVESTVRDDQDLDPEMQMNTYHVNELLFVLQRAGALRFHTEFTNHGGELGLVIFFAKPPINSDVSAADDAI